MSGGASSLDGKLLVAAIDFGTAYSGYAYSFRNDYKLDPLKITTNHWTGEGSQTMSPKAPSSVLLNPEEEYSNLVENGQHKDWYFFKEIKMRLLYNLLWSLNLNVRECDHYSKIVMKYFIWYVLPLLSYWTNIKLHFDRKFLEQLPLTMNAENQC